MPWVMQMAGCAVTLIGIAFIMWVGFWMFLVLFALGLCIASWARIRSYLIAKGILNPIPGVARDAEDDAPPTIIDGDYKRLDSDSE